MNPIASWVDSKTALKTFTNIGKARRFARRVDKLGRFALLINLVSLFAALNSIGPAEAQPAEPALVAAITTDHSGSATAFSPDGKTLAITSEQGVKDTVTFWDVATKRKLEEICPAKEASSRLIYSPDGRSLALFSEFAVYLYDLNKRSSRLLCRSEKYPQDGIRMITYSPDGKHLATGDFAGRVKLWKIDNGKIVADTNRKGPINDLAFLPDGQTIVGAADPLPDADSPQNGIWIWDVNGKRKTRFFNGCKYPVQRLAVSPDGKTVVTSSYSNEVWLWDIEKEAVRDKWSAQFNLVHAVMFSRDGRILIAAGGHGNLPGSRFFPGQVTIWDARTGKRLQTCRALDVTIGKIALSPDGKLLAVSPSDHLLRVNVWDISHIMPNDDRPKK